MSLNHQEIINCSRCRHRQEFKVWDSLNVSADPSAKRSLLNGDLTTFRCTRCRAKETIEFNCLYHDMRSSLAIWLKHPEQGQDVAIDPAANEMFSNLAMRYKRRVVRSFHELVDKIRIFDDGYDDHTIELIKLLICIREEIHLAHPFHYAKVTSSWFKGKWFVFAVEDDGEFVERSVPMANALEAVKPVLAQIQPLIDCESKGFIPVNRITMLRFLEKSGLLREISVPSSSRRKIQVHSIGRTPPINELLDLDEWVFSGARTYKIETWEIGKEVSGADAAKWCDPQTGDLHVFHQIVDGEWQAFFITKEKFDLLRALEDRI